MAADPNKIILTGENPFIRLSATGGEPFTAFGTEEQKDG